jgi:hypothetical protein
MRIIRRLTTALVAVGIAVGTVGMTMPAAANASTIAAARPHGCSPDGPCLRN